MSTPRNIRKQAAEAERLHGELFGTEKQPLTLEVKEDESAPQEPEPADAPQFTPGNASPTPEPAQQDQPTPPPPSVKPEDTLEFWKSKYQTLDGKYRAEVPRAAADLRDLKAQVQSLQATIAAMSSAGPPAEAPAAGGKSLVTEQEVEEYGEDFVSVMRRVAQEEAGRAVQRVVPKIEQVEGRLQQGQAQTQRDRVWAMLDSNVEDWRTINRSQAFLDWLAEEDPYAGSTRSAMLTNAFETGDGSRVASFFRGFLAEKAMVTPKPPTGNGVDTQTPPGRVQPQLNLEQLAGPRAPGGSGTPTARDESPQPWTRRQIAAFYKDAQLGVFKTDPEKYKRIQTSIERAVQAGLVTP